MATRFYFNVTKAADLALSRPLNGFWEVNTSVLQTTRRLTTTRYGGTVIGPTVTVGNGTNPNDQLWFQGISGPLAAQTISGTLTGVMVVRESPTSANLTTKVRVYVVNKTGSVVATLYDGSGESTEWNSPSANTRDFWAFGSASISSYSCSDGDRIVVEIGCRVASTRTADTAYMYLGDQSTTSDLPSGDASSNNQTLSPWIQFSGNLTFGYTENKTLPADAVIKATVASSITADAWIETGGSTITDAITADAVVLKTVSGSIAANAVVKTTPTGAITADALLSILHSGSVTADAIIQDTPAVIIDDPFDDPETVAGTWGTRWTMITGIEGSTAELGRNPTDGAFVYDNSNTVLDSERGGYVNRRTYQKGSISARVKYVQAAEQLVGGTRIAVYLRHSGETSGLGYYNAEYVGVELIVGVAGAPSLQIRDDYQTVRFGPVDLSSYLGTVAEGDEFYLKGYVKGSRVKAKVWRVGDPEPRPQINEVLSGLPSAGYKGVVANSKTSWKPVEWHVRRVTAYNLDFSIDVDAVIKATVDASVTADAVVQVTRSSSVTANAVITAGVSTVTGSIPADAVQRRTEPHSITADASILAPRSATITASAIVQGSVPGTIAANAVIEKTVQGSIAADAITSVTRTGGVLAAAVILSPTPGTLPADAIIRATIPGSISADAYAIYVRVGSITADAMARIVRSGAVTADAVYLRRITGTIAADAVVTRPLAGPPADWSLMARELDHVVTARELDHAVTAREIDWTINQTNAASITADAWIV